LVDNIIDGVYSQGMGQELRKLKSRIVEKWQKRIEKSSYSISSIAKKAKVSRATIHNAINGTRIPHTATVNKIEDLLIEDEEKNGEK
jgi:predicted transcriptional regulator